MAIFRCKMCGGSLEIQENQSVAICEYCGTAQTLPKLDDEHKANLIDRANHFRRNNEFDKAAAIYEQILEEDKTDAESYWSLVLCKYGIEYVEDPASYKRVPTVNRAQFTSIFLDENYQAALQYADSNQRVIYEEEARVIDDIQKGILEISSKEEPFDVFICYKETDAAGARTVDSVLAQDIYYQLVEKGYKVFFSRITLESKLGRQYEPYIFAALNSAKVMVVVGTRAEYFNAVWVKNEWSRFLKLAQEKKDRLIIPAYKGMDPYDMPDALSYYQAQDMSKIGFIQDLIRGIQKVLSAEKSKKEYESVSNNGEVGGNLTALLRRGNLALEDREWNKAYEFFDQALNINPECSEAYFGQGLAENHASNGEEYVRVRLSATELAEMTIHELFAEKNIKDELEKQMKNNGLAETFLSALDIPIIYETSEESRIQQLSRERDLIEGGKLFGKALRFARKNEQKTVVDMKEALCSEMERRIKEARQNDTQALFEAKKILDEKISHVARKMNTEIERLECEYVRLRRLYDERQKDDYSNLDKLKKGFESLKSYKDSEHYCKMIDELFNEQKRKLEELQDKRRSIIDSFWGLGRFETKRRKELESQLASVTEEYERLLELYEKSTGKFYRYSGDAGEQQSVKRHNAEANIMDLASFMSVK